MINSKGKYEQTEKCKNNLRKKHMTADNFVGYVSNFSGQLNQLDFSFESVIKEKYNCVKCVYGFEYRLNGKCKENFEPIPKEED